MTKNKIIINKAASNKPYVVVKGGNNKTIATTETYQRIAGAKAAAEALQRVIKNAVVINKIK